MAHARDGGKTLEALPGIGRFGTRKVPREVESLRE
jgi:hypothetical protein